MSDEQRVLEISDLTSTMNTTAGRNVIFRILSSCGVDINQYQQNPHDHAYNAGMRSVGLTLISELKDTVPDEYYLMLREHNDG